MSADRDRGIRRVKQKRAKAQKKLRRELFKRAGVALTPPSAASA